MPVVYQKDEKQSILRKAQQSLVSKEREPKGGGSGSGSGRKPRKCQVFPMSHCDLQLLMMTELKTLYIKEFQKQIHLNYAYFLGQGILI